MTKSKKTRAQRRKERAEQQKAVQPDVVEAETSEANLEEIRSGLDANQCVVQLTCKEDVRISVYENKHIADAAEEATAAYVMGIGQFPDPKEPVVTTVATRDASFGPFIVSCSLVVEAKELRG